MVKVMITLAGMGLVAGLEVLALHHGIDGLCLASSVAIIGGLAGFRIGKLR